MPDTPNVTQLLPSETRPPDTPPVPPPDSSTGGALKRLLIPLLATAAILAGVAFVMINWNRWTAGAASQSTDDAVVTADVSTLSARISGNIQSAPVADYQTVKQGQLLVEIDSREYDAAVQLAKANVAAAEASLANLANQIELQTAAIEAVVAQNASAMAQRTQTQQELQRQTDLRDATSQQLLQQAQAAFLQADAAVKSSDAAIAQQRAQLKVLNGQSPLLKAQVAAANANLDTAVLHQSYSRIYAPFDGVVGRRLVHEGDFVSVGTSIIAEVPLPKVYVTANFKETQLSLMTPGRPAEIAIDTFPGHVLHGKVARLSPASGSVFALLPPDNATGNYTKVVQRVPVRIELDADQPLVDRLRPGMSAAVTVDTSDAEP